MIKRFSLVLAAALVLLTFGIVGAGQIDGLQSNAGPALPSLLNNYVNPGGTGDALVYNYFNARSGMVTYFSVVNTDDTRGSRVRIRFYEGADIANNGVCTIKEPRGSFEVLDFDICLSAGDMWTGFIKENAATGGAMLCSTDDDTLIVSSDTAPAALFPKGCVDFKFGNANTVRAITAANTLEGYFVVIGEDRLAPVVSGGTCGPKWRDTGADVPNKLTGNVQLVNDTNSFVYNAVAIADFAAVDLRRSIASNDPQLSSGTDGIQGVNYILTKSDLYSVYDVLSPAQTSFVLTSPTKRLSQICLLTDLWDDKTVKFTTWSDDEKSPTSTCDFSPCPPGSTNRLPYEVNVIALDGSNLVDSTVDQVVATPFDLGWFRINLIKPTHNTIFDGVMAKGLPMVGLTLTNDGAFPMQYRTFFEAAPLP